MTTKEKPEKVWHRTDFAIESGDQCQCYKHRTATGNRKRCPTRAGFVGLSDPESPNNDILRIYCIDCWIACRKEKTIQDPAQTRMYEQMRKDRMTLSRMGC